LLLDDTVLDRYREDAGINSLRCIALTIGGLCCASASIREYLVTKLKEEEERNGVEEIVTVLEGLVDEQMDDERISDEEDDDNISKKEITRAQQVLAIMRTLV
jgi:hypothetical protein